MKKVSFLIAILLFICFFLIAATKPEMVNVPIDRLEELEAKIEKLESWNEDGIWGKEVHLSKNYPGGILWLDNYGNGFALRTNGITFFDGDVGIGVDDPQASLDVNGPIRVAGVTFRIEKGTIETPINSNGWQSFPRVSFSSPFSETPLIFLTIDNTASGSLDYKSLRIEEKSNSGFVGHLCVNAYYPGNMRLNWMAIGK